MLKTTMHKQSKQPYISFNLKISRGTPVISGTRVRVIDIAIEYDRLGFSPDQIIDAHPHLTLEYENKKALDSEIRGKREIVEKLSKERPSILKRAIS